MNGALASWQLINRCLVTYLTIRIKWRFVVRCGETDLKFTTSKTALPFVNSSKTSATVKDANNSEVYKIISCWLMYGSFFFCLFFLSKAIGINDSKLQFNKKKRTYMRTNFPNSLIYVSMVPSYCLFYSSCYLDMHLLDTELKSAFHAGSVTVQNSLHHFAFWEVNSSKHCGPLAPDCYAVLLLIPG